MPATCTNCDFTVNGPELPANVVDALFDIKEQSEFRREQTLLRRLSQHLVKQPDLLDLFLMDRIALFAELGVNESSQRREVAPDVDLPPQPIDHEDPEVAAYLRKYCICYSKRIHFVETRRAELEVKSRLPKCPQCGIGTLVVHDADWQSFANEFVSQFFRPALHRLHNDGLIEVSCSTWGRFDHSSGTTLIAPKSPDYDFWYWLVRESGIRGVVSD